MQETPDFTDVLAQELNARPYWLHLGSALRKSMNPSRESLASALISAFDYMLTAEDGTPRERWGVFAPMLEMSEGVYPAPIEKIDEASLAAWTRLADEHRDPIVTARTNDLLWVRRWGARPDQRARAALAAYRALGEERWSPLYRAHALVRALEIARELRDDGECDSLAPALVAQCRSALGSETPIPGVTVLLLTALIRTRRPRVSDDIDHLLALASDAYPTRPDVFEAVKDLEVIWARKDRGRVQEAQRAVVRRWHQAAAGAKGMVRQSHLQKALEHARLYGLDGEAETIRKELQSISLDDLELKQFSAEASVPRDQLDPILRAIVGGTTWDDCLMRFGGYGPPTGRPDENRQFIEEQRRRFPLQFLVTQTVVSREGYPLHVATTDDEKFDLALAQHETMQVSIWSAFAPGLLSEVFARHGRPTRDALTQFFTTQIIRKENADRLGLALELFLDGRHDEAVHVAVPRLESILRELCRSIGLVIIREPRNGRPGGVVAVWDLIAGLKDHLHEGWRRYLLNVLADPLGTNLRNRVAHGLLDAATAGDAAVCLHIACHLRLLEIQHA